MTDSSEISSAELDAIDRRSNLASPSPWTAFVEGRDHSSGDTFIKIGVEHDDTHDMYVTVSKAGEGTKTASAIDLDFIAHARQDIPRLIEEVRRLKRLLADSADGEK